MVDKKFQLALGRTECLYIYFGISEKISIKVYVMDFGNNNELLFFLAESQKIVPFSFSFGQRQVQSLRNGQV